MNESKEHMEIRKMNQHEIMDNMTHKEFETINNENSSNEEKAKAWNDASKRIENYYQRTSYIHEDLQELIKLLHVISDNLLCIQDNLCSSNIMHDYKQSFDDIQILLTTVDKDKLHVLANSLKENKKNEESNSN